MKNKPLLWNLNSNPLKSTVSTALLSTTHFSSGLLFLYPLFSLLHSLFYSFYPMASAAIDQFKLLLTGSAGDLWLHLSRTRNPLPSGLAHFILSPLPGLSGLPSSLRPVSSPLRKHLSLACLFVYVDIFMRLIVSSNPFFF